VRQERGVSTGRTASFLQGCLSASAASTNSVADINEIVLCYMHNQPWAWGLRAWGQVRPAVGSSGTAPFGECSRLGITGDYSCQRTKPRFRNRAGHQTAWQKR